MSNDSILKARCQTEVAETQAAAPCPPVNPLILSELLSNTTRFENQLVYSNLCSNASRTYTALSAVPMPQKLAVSPLN